MRYPNWKLFTLSYIVGLLAYLGVFPFSSYANQNARSEEIKTCTGQRIVLNTPQLTNADLKNLGNCSSETIPQLLEALKSQDWKVKAIAAYTLGLFGAEAKSAIPSLSNLIQDENADIRFVAAQTLGEIGTDAVLPALTKAIQDQDENVRVSAAVAFQKIGAAAKPAKPILIDALWDGNWYVRSRAARTIAKLGLEESDIPNLLKPWRAELVPEEGALVSLMIAIDPQVRQRIETVPLRFIKALQNSDPKIRESAAIALREINPTRVSEVYLFNSIDSLLKTSQDRDPQIRQNAILALGSALSGHKQHQTIKERQRLIPVRKAPLVISQLPKIESALLRGLQDTDSKVRQAIIDTLKETLAYKVSLPNLISALLKRTQDPDTEVRQAAIKSLGIHWSTALKRSEHSDNTDAGSGILPAERSKLSQAILSTLVKLLNDRNEEVRRAAWLYLPEAEFLTMLSKVLQDRQASIGVRRTATATALERIKSSESPRVTLSERAVNALEKALQDPDSTIRFKAALALQDVGKLDAKPAVTMFMEALQSDRPVWRLDAITGLNQLCSPSLEDPQNTKTCSEAKSSIPLLVKMLKDENKPIRYAAALAIANIDPKDESGVDVLREILLKESNYYLREHAINALREEIGSKRALSIIIQSSYLDDKQARYSRSCVYSAYLQIDRNNDGSTNGSTPSSMERLSLVLDALKDPGLRFSAAATLSSMNESQIDISRLTSMLNVDSNQYENSTILKDVFKFKNQDLRRSIVYAIGKIGSTIKPDETGNAIENAQQNGQRLEARRKIAEALNTIYRDKTEDLDSQWMAAVFLQDMDTNTNGFFVENQLINPKLARWQFSHGSVPWKPQAFIPGIIFDTYSGELLYDDRTGCGDGLADIYNTLRSLLGRK